MGAKTANRRETQWSQQLFSAVHSDCVKYAKCPHSEFAYGRLASSVEKRWGEPNAAIRRATLDEYFNYASSPPVVDLSNPVLVRARTLLRRWLAFQDWMLGCFVDGMGDGPGVSAGVSQPDYLTKSLSSSGFAKRTSAVTYSCQAVLDEYCGWMRNRPDFARELAEHGASQAYPEIRVVKKNARIGRTIILFPTADMRLQKGFASILRRVLEKSVGITLEVRDNGRMTSDQQRINRMMAFIGSKTSSYATEDLKRASDSLCLETLEFLLPEWTVNSVKLFTSPVRAGKQLCDRGRILLDMGNDITFPLQTLVFAAVCVALLQLSGYRYVRNGHEFAVFGDDIIVPTAVHKGLRLALHAMGCQSNAEKSFSTGPFRESCGGDYWLGRNVTPFYIERLRTRRDVYIAVNKLTAWESRTGLSLPQTRAVLIDILSERRWWHYVPPYAPETAGIRTWDFDRWLIKSNEGGLISFKAWVDTVRYPRMHRKTFEGLSNRVQLMLCGAIRSQEITGRPKKLPYLVKGTLWGDCNGHLAIEDEYKHLPDAY